MSSNQYKRTSLIFAEYHDSLTYLERVCHNMGISISLYEALNDRLEKTVVILNLKTHSPVKSILLEGKTAWQVIKEIVQEIPEEYGYEAPISYSRVLREFIRSEMKEKNISETDIAQKAKQSLSIVSYTLSGRRKSTHIMEIAAIMLGYESLEDLIAASRGKEAS